MIQETFHAGPIRRGFVRPLARLLLVGIGLLPGCGDSEMAPRTLVALSLRPDSLAFPAIPASITVSVVAFYSDGDSADVSASPRTVYLSADPGVAGFGDGIASSSGEGGTFLVASHAEASDTAYVTVDEDLPIPVARFELDREEIVLTESERTSLGAEIAWANGARLAATGFPFLYETEEARVATVSSSGAVTAVGGGETRILVRFRDEVRATRVRVGSIRSVDFGQEIQPILLASCASAACHPGSRDLPARSDLRLDSYENLMAGGGNGPVVLPGRPESSRIVLAIRGVLEGTLPMPIANRLPNVEIETIERWIAQGACRAPGNCPDTGGLNSHVATQ